ncbi:MAG: hypothetical protein IIT39_06335, partial [Clostridia bacterium]|nr:hypothetical protein [Clostridia bacterium]
MLEYILMAVPAVFIALSIVYAYKTVAVGKITRKKAVLSQIIAFGLVSITCLAFSLVAFAAEPEA